MREAGSLRSRSIKGVAWNAAGNAVQQIILLVTMVVLARILSPEEFGIYALLMVFVSFSQILAQMGTSSAVIYFDDVSNRFLSTAFFFSVGVSVILYLVLFVLSVPLASFMDEPALINLLRMIGVVVVLNGLGLVHKALLEKNLDFKTLILIENTALVCASFVGVLAAVLGVGAMSFVLMSVFLSLLQLIGFIVFSKWRPKMIFGLSELQRMLSYSLNLLGFTVINYFARQTDDLLVGKVIGASALGVYSIAYRIMLYPLQNVSRVLVRVIFPAFSTIKYDNVRLKLGYVQAISFIAFLTFPLMLGLFSLSDLFVSVVFGEEWHELSPLLGVLSFVGLQQSVVTTVGSIYLAKGTTWLMFRIGALNALITVISFLIGVWFGIFGMAIAYLVANLLMLYPNLYFAWRQIDLGVFEGLGKLGIFLVASGVMAGSIIGVRQTAWINALPEFTQLLVLVIFGAVVYAVFLLISAPRRVRLLISIRNAIEEA